MWHDQAAMHAIWRTGVSRIIASKNRLSGSGRGEDSFSLIGPAATFFRREKEVAFDGFSGDLPFTHRTFHNAASKSLVGLPDALGHLIGKDVEFIGS